MTNLLHSLMDATDHLMEEGASDELVGGLARWAYDIDGFQTYSTIQPDLQSRQQGSKNSAAPELLTSKARSPNRWKTISADDKSS